MLYRFTSCSMLFGVVLKQSRNYLKSKVGQKWVLNIFSTKAGGAYQLITLIRLWDSSHKTVNAYYFYRREK